MSDSERHISLPTLLPVSDCVAQRGPVLTGSGLTAEREGSSVSGEQRGRSVPRVTGSSETLTQDGIVRCVASRGGFVWSDIRRR
ncbi:hypothetical protein NQZ68_020660 [Dissostichus eleginoides]|nr:hypothetical protein NQZ68_020660 [Dissostichus eleginoides]